MFSLRTYKEKYTSRTCVNRHILIKRAEKSFSLAVCAPTTTTTIYEMIIYVFSENKKYLKHTAMKPVEVKLKEQRHVCQRCTTLIKTAYNSHKHLLEIFAKESYIADHF